MSQSVEIIIDGNAKAVPVGIKISDVLSLSDMPCSGKGRCGKCKVTAMGALSDISEDEKKLLSQKELEMGVRLACQARILGKCEISRLGQDRQIRQILTEVTAQITDTEPFFERYGIALDIGTTTLGANLYGARGQLLAAFGMENPQVTYGADVISRIEASLNGRSEELARCILDAVDKTVLSLCESADISTGEIDALVITGNTAMLYLLTNSSPKTLAMAPFIPDRYFGECFSATKLGISCLNSDTAVYIPPCIGAFVGADALCAILASGITDQKEASLLADIGTNGEMALFYGGKLTVCSTAAGPAFEGVGISQGMRASDGAIDRVSIVNGKLFCHVIGDKKPIGICGSGLIDAVAALLDLDLIDETGYIDGGNTELEKGVCLTQNDVRATLLAKSAICAGILTLLQRQNARLDEISSLYIAGGFGKYLSIRNAARVGLIPKKLQNRVKVMGNLALSGASALLLSKGLWQKAYAIAETTSVTELSTDPVFARLYMENMMFDSKF